MLTRAEYTVELATQVGVNPVTWTDISGYVLTMDWGIGRDDWLSDMQPGTGRLVVRNDGGEFFTERTDSPLYPHLDDMRAVRLRCTFLGTLYPLFFAYIQSVLPDPDYNTQRAVITLADGFSWLELAKGTAVFSNALSGVNVGAVLDMASWPAGLRSIDAGQSTFLPTYTNQDAKSQLKGIATDNEAGLFYLDRSGNATFEDRHHRLKTDHLISQGTFDYLRNLVPEAPARDILNSIEVTYDSGSVTREDAASASAYGPRTFPISAQFLSLSEATARADWTLSQRKDRHPRPVATLQAASDALRTAILDLTISDRITVPDADDTGIDGDYFIERAEHSVDMASQEHTCTWQLSPVDQNTYWLLGVVGYSEMGVSTRTGY